MKTLKSAEEIAKEILEAACMGPYGSDLADNDNLFDLLTESIARRIQAERDARLPSREDVFDWHKRQFDKYGKVPLPIETIEWYLGEYLKTSAPSSEAKTCATAGSTPKAEEARVMPDENELRKWNKDFFHRHERAPSAMEVWLFIQHWEIDNTERPEDTK